MMADSYSHEMWCSEVGSTGEFTKKNKWDSDKRRKPSYSMETAMQCPRCKRDVMYVLDWGKSGKLFVHYEFIENGMPAKEACHVWAEELEKGLRWDHDLR